MAHVDYEYIECAREMYSIMKFKALYMRGFALICLSVWHLFYYLNSIENFLNEISSVRVSKQQC